MAMRKLRFHVSSHVHSTLGKGIISKNEFSFAATKMNEVL
jgi:hypothetical protein